MRMTQFPRFARQTDIAAIIAALFASGYYYWDRPWIGEASAMTGKQQTNEPVVETVNVRRTPLPDFPVSPPAKARP